MVKSFLFLPISYGDDEHDGRRHGKPRDEQDQQLGVLAATQGHAPLRPTKPLRIPSTTLWLFAVADPGGAGGAAAPPRESDFALILL